MFRCETESNQLPINQQERVHETRSAIKVQVERPLAETHLDDGNHLPRLLLPEQLGNLIHILLQPGALLLHAPPTLLKHNRLGLLLKRLLRLLPRCADNNRKVVTLASNRLLDLHPVLAQYELV